MGLLFNYLSLCWFRGNPLDLQPTQSFMWKTIAFYLVIGIIVEGLIADFADGTLEVLMRTVMAFSTIALFLLSIKQWRIFFQLFTAIFVCENFIMTLATMSEGLDELMVARHYEFREEVSIALATILVLWYLALVAYILRKTLDYNMNASLVMAFTYFVLTYGVPMGLMDI
jgi:hypothetical protein